MAQSDNSVEVSIGVNGSAVRRRISPRQSLADFLRYDLGFTGTHVGCEHGICGACTVRLNGQIVRSCLTLAVQVDSQEVETIEGVTASGEIADLQSAFQRNNAAQCGFCTPGMLLTAAEFLSLNDNPDRQAIRDYLSGNLCRCTGYQAIVDAVEQTAKQRADGDQNVGQKC